GIPLHSDNQTVVRERIYLDKADRSLLRDEITTIDHALTRPWVVMKTYRRVATDKPIWWRGDICAEGNNHVRIGAENYYLTAKNCKKALSRAFGSFCSSHVSTFLCSHSLGVHRIDQGWPPCGLNPSNG